MGKERLAEERAAREKFEAWLREIEDAAAEIVEVGGLIVQGRGAERSCTASPVSTLQARKGCAGAAGRAGARCGAAGGKD